MFEKIQSFIDRFREKSNSDTSVNGMLRLVTECGIEALPEVLGELAFAHGEGTILTVAEIKSREIFCTTDGNAKGLIRNIVHSIFSLERKCYFLVGQKSSVLFRKGIECLRIIPLSFGEEARYALIIELPKMEKALPRQYYDVLALCVTAIKSKQDISSVGSVDELSKLKTRDVLLLDAKNRYETDKNCKIVCLALSEDSIFKKGQIKELPVYHARCAEILKEETDIVYSISMGVFAILATGNEFDVIADVNNLIDRCFEGEIELKAGVSVLEKDEYLSLYLAERGARSAKEGQVIFVRDKDSIYTKEDVYSTFRDPGTLAIGEEVETIDFTANSKKSEDGDLEFQFESKEQENADEEACED